jgi:hypothetical protein
MILWKYKRMEIVCKYQVRVQACKLCVFFEQFVPDNSNPCSWVFREDSLINLQRMQDDRKCQDEAESWLIEIKQAYID